MIAVALVGIFVGLVVGALSLGIISRSSRPSTLVARVISPAEQRRVDEALARAELERQLALSRSGNRKGGSL